MKAWWNSWMVLVGATACMDGGRLVPRIEVPDSAHIDGDTEGDSAQLEDTYLPPEDAYAPPIPTRWAIVGPTLLGTGDPAFEGRVAPMLIDDGIITAIGLSTEFGTPPSDTIHLDGLWVTPAFIDSHVHLRYWDVAAALLDAGVVAAVDLAAPPDFHFADWAGLDVIGSGPMITPVSGYPTQSWGRDGYGRECATIEDAIAAVDEASMRGARVIKIPFGAGPDFDDEIALAIIDHAHSLGLLVVAHALTNAAAKRAGELGADVLGHTPVERLDDATVALWSGRVVVSTIAAFGATPTTVDNLRRLHLGGARVLYGTDLGNNRVAGIDPRELALMVDAGLDFDAVLASATGSAASVWGFSEYGTLAAGKAAVLLVYGRDPREDPTHLAAPVDVLDLR